MTTNRRLRWICAVFSSFLMGISLPGCAIPERENEVEGGCSDNFDTDQDGRIDCEDTDCNNHCSCLPPDQCPDRTNDMGGLTDTQTVTLPYLYVWINDKQSPFNTDTTMTEGVDIDAVELISGGQSLFAETVSLCQFAVGDNTDASDCNELLREPDGCDLNADDTEFVSLSRTGNVIVSFGSGVEIQAGDTITVHACDRTTDNPPRPEERYDAFVGVSPTDTTDLNWVPCIINGSGVASCTVPALPQVQQIPQEQPTNNFDDSLDCIGSPCNTNADCCGGLPCVDGICL